MIKNIHLILLGILLFVPLLAFLLSEDNPLPILKKQHLPMGIQLLQTTYARITHYPGPDAARAKRISATIDDLYPRMFMFSTNISRYVPAPEAVSIDLTNEQFGIMAVIAPTAYIARTHRTRGFPISINLGAMINDTHTRSVTVHELFHHISYRTGIITPRAVQDRANRWIIEGTAEIAEYYFLPRSDHIKLGFVEYIKYPKYHQKVGLTRSGHHAALFFYYLWQEQGIGLDTVMQLFAKSHDSRQMLKDLKVTEYWHDFTKRMWNQPPIKPIAVDGAPLVDGSGDPIIPDLTGKNRTILDPETGIHNLELSLPPLSWRHQLYQIPDDQPWADFGFAHLAQSGDLIVHAYLQDRETKSYRYQDWSSRQHRTICNQQTGPCAGEPLDKTTQLVLIIANKSSIQTLTGMLTASLAASVDRKPQP